MSASTTLLHASSVAIAGHAVVMTGASGAGKSSLALQLLSLGAVLIADDQTLITRTNDTLWAAKPETLPSQIEARGIGLIDVKTSEPCKVALVINLDEVEDMRHPEPRTKQILGRNITVWRNVPEPYFPSAIIVYISSMPKCQAIAL